MSVSKVCVLACAIGVASAAAPKADELTGEYSFSQYKVHFGKTYTDAEEDASRQKIFAQNLQKILAHNAGGKSWKMGVSQFTDRKDEELPMGNTITKNMKLVEELKQQPHVGVHEMTGKALPTKVDWRAHQPTVVSPVKNQGNCGDCWAHATVETVESHWAIKHPGRLWTLSQQQVTDCTEDKRHCGGTGGCQGALYELGWEQMKKGNIASEWVYPFTSFGGSSSSANCHKPASDTTVVLTGYKHVANTTEDLMDAVANVGPVAIAVSAMPWMHYESGVFDGCSYPLDIDHAVVVEGYGTDESGQDYWLIRNSWSPSWGEDGYIRIDRPSKAPCGTVIHNADGLGCEGDPSTIPACGTCGINLDAAYPTLE